MRGARIGSPASNEGAASVASQGSRSRGERRPLVDVDVASGDGSTLMTVREIADALGVRPRTIRNYHQEAQQHRRDDETRPGDFPEPDARFGLTPVWRAATIRDWQARRPGRGAGGGRPRKETS